MMPLINYLSKFRRYVKYAYNYIYNILLYVFYKQKNKPQGLEKGNIFLNFKTNIYRRNLANIVFWFSDQGYVVYIKHSFLSIGSISFYARLIFKINRLKLTNKIPQRINYYFSGYKKDIDIPDRIYLNMDYYQDEDIYTWHIPEGMHPYMYYKKYYKDVEKYRISDTRRIRIFFSGNVDKELYEREEIFLKYNKMSRYKIWSFLCKRFHSNIFIPRSLEELFYNNFSDMIVLNDRKKLMIEQEKFLPLLSECDFFIFTPGVVAPLCHNNSESMAAGCIPILQYPEFFYPNLTDNVNCLVFNNEEELVDKINHALKMSAEEILQLQTNVIKYYEENLTPKGIIQNFEKRAATGLKQILIPND